jgi:hypothetical protein
MQELLSPSTNIDAIREILMLAVGLLVRFLEIRRIKKKQEDE